MATTGATHFNTLQHTATHCNTLQHTATRCGISIWQHRCNSLQHIAPHCNTFWNSSLPPLTILKRDLATSRDPVTRPNYSSLPLLNETQSLAPWAASEHNAYIHRKRPARGIHGEVQIILDRTRSLCRKVNESWYLYDE